VFLDLDQALVDAISRESPKASADARSGKRNAPADASKPHKGFIGTHFYSSVARFESLVDFVTQHGPYAQKVMGWIEENGDPNERSLMLTWLFNLFAKYQHVVSRASDGKNILIDEGFIGRAVTLFAYRAEPPIDATRTYVKLAPKPDAIIRLNVDLEECHTRLSSRPKGPPARLRSLSKEQQLRILENCRQVLETALSELSASGVRIIDIDSGRPPPEQIAAAASALGLPRG